MFSSMEVSSIAAIAMVSPGVAVSTSSVLLSRSSVISDIWMPALRESI
ncbi:hypothetical protein [Novosphingobium panipatense]